MFELNQASNEFLFHNRKVFSEQLGFLINFFRGNSQIESSHSLRQNDAKFQTHPPITLLVKMPNLPKMDAYNFRYNEAFLSFIQVRKRISA